MSLEGREYPQTGIYEHFKSTPDDERHYRLLGFGRHTETEEVLAVYIPLYVTPEHIVLKMQLRPLDMFMEEIEHEGKTLPRYKYIGPGAD